MTKNIIIVFSLFILSLITPRQITAAATCSQGNAADCECNDLLVVNQTQNQSVTNRFTFQAQDCNRSFTYEVWIQKSISNNSYDTLFTLDLTQEYCGPTGYCLQNPSPYPLNASGEYRAVLHSTNTTTGETESDRYKAFYITEIGEEDGANAGMDPGLSTSALVCGGDSDYIISAFGCVPFGNAIELAAGLANFGVAIGGGVAFILIGYASLKTMASQGNPQAIKGAKEMITGAIGGIIMLVLSVFILRLIGVKILGIF